jgi:hypothetical protein
MDRETDYGRTPFERFLLTKVVDPHLNYGRTIISQFISEIVPVGVVLDIGAGEGKDLETARQLCPTASAIAIEGHGPYAAELERREFNVLRVNIEYDRFPFDDCSVDLVIANQILEHTKEIFWIFHEISRT